MREPEALLELAKAGDQGAWRELVAHYRRLVHSVIRHHRIPESDAEDLFQEVFVRLYRYADRIREPRALTRWVTVTTRYLCLDAIARRRTAERGAHRVPVPQSPSSALEDILRLEQAHEVRSAMARLPAPCRALLEQLFFHGDRPDYAAVAAALGMPVGSIGPTRARCLERLMRLLSRPGQEDR